MKKIISAMLIGVAAFATINMETCKGCHGKNWEKKALDKSKILAKMSHDEIVSALQGYKDGTYGNTMKGLMKGMVSEHSYSDLANIKIKKNTASIENIEKSKVKRSKHYFVKGCRNIIAGEDTKDSNYTFGYIVGAKRFMSYNMFRYKMVVSNGIKAKDICKEFIRIYNQDDLLDYSMIELINFKIKEDLMLRNDYSVDDYNDKSNKVKKLFK
jgi:cytochrome c